MVRIDGLRDGVIDELVEFELVDEIGNSSDEITLKFSNTFIRPLYGKELKVYLDGLYYGIFIVQTTTKDSNYLSVKATATDFSKNIKEKKNRSFEKITLAKIIEIIASNNGLDFKCDFDVYLPHLTQTNESDLNLMQRLANVYNAQFSLKNHTIIFIKHKEDTKLPIFSIRANEVISYSFTHKAKAIYKSVLCKYQDTKKNKVVSVLCGAGKPCYEYQASFKNEADAKIKGNAMLQNLNRAIINGRINLPHKEVRAGGILEIRGFHEDDGKYTINKVTHNFNNSSLKTKIEIQK